MVFYYLKSCNLEYLVHFFSVFHNHDYILKEHADRTLIIKNSISRNLTSEFIGRYTGLVFGDCYEVRSYNDTYWVVSIPYMDENVYEETIPFLKFEKKFGDSLYFNLLLFIEEENHRDYFTGMYDYINGNYKDYAVRITLIIEDFFNKSMEYILNEKLKGRNGIKKIKEDYSKKGKFSDRINYLRTVMSTIQLNSNEKEKMELFHHTFHSLRIIRNRFHHSNIGKTEINSAYLFETLFLLFREIVTFN